MAYKGIRALGRSITVGALLVSVACTSQAPEADKPAAAPAASDAVQLTSDAISKAGITIEAAEMRSVTDHILVPGLIALDDTRTARVGSLQEGLILSTLAQVGDRVTSRQLLATMHGHALHDAWSGYRKAIAERQRADKELAYAVAAYERTNRLYTAKAVSLQDVQRADVERVSAEKSLDVAVAEVNRAIQELEHVGVAINDNTGSPENTEDVNEQIPIRSPMAGTVLERLVTPGTTVTPGSPLFVVSDLSTLWAVAEIDETRLPLVKVGRSVEVSVAAYPDERFTGTTIAVGEMIDPKTRRVTVRSAVPNPQGRLKPEMFATIAIGQSDSRTVVTVPQAAVQTIDGRTVVFVSAAEGRFMVRPVDLGSDSGDAVEIKSGLSAGERVVVAGSFVLKSELMKSADGGGQ
jgi:cobalt-zinc-cadmium efflux system membrane fusion protein